MPKIDYISSDTLETILYLSSYQMCTSMRKLSLSKAKGISQQFVKLRDAQELQVTVTMEKAPQIN